MAAAAVATWHAVHRGARRVLVATGTGARRAGRATTSTAGRVRSVLAHDAHAVAASTTAAGRRLRPAPLLDDTTNTTDTTETAETAETADGAETAETAGLPVGTPAGDTRTDLHRPGGTDGNGRSPAVPTATTPTPPARAPERAAARPPQPEPARPPELAANRAPGREPARPPVREGIVVPLRVPWTARLRATAGLCALVVFLGTATATVIAAIAIGAAQALGSL